MRPTTIESGQFQPGKQLRTLRNLMPYLWPRERADLRLRVVLAIVFLVAAKAANVCVPILLRDAVDGLGAPVMIDVGTTGMGAGMPGGLGAKIRHAHPLAVDDLAADFPNLKIVAAHPGWPWSDEMTAVALHKGNVYWEMSGWAPKYFPQALKKDIASRLQDKIMFGSDYPSIPHERLLREWDELGYPEALMEKIFHGNAERILGL